jgi:protein-S-isoprenylcysteine O-methyltransferase Ste14
VSDATPKRRSWPGRLRIASVFVLVGALVVLSRPSPGSVSVGFAIAAVGEAIRVWAAGHLRKTVRLVTSGPYRYSRNPLYLGRLLIFTGIAVMAWMPRGATFGVIAAGWIVFFVYYLPRKERVEPARLRAVHGEAYDRYRGAVGKLFPRWPAYRGGADAGWSSERMIANREHWMIIAVVLVTLVLLARAYQLETGAALQFLGDPP